MTFAGTIAATMGRQSLGRRIAIDLLAFGLVGVVAILLLLSSIIDQRFQRLEEQEMAGHLDRAAAMLDNMQRAANARSLDWAVWNDSYDYLRSPGRNYETTNFTASAFQNISSEAMGFVRFDGKFSKAVYFNLKTGEMNAPAAAAFAQIVAAPDLRDEMRRKASQSGFIRSGNRVLVVGAAQVLKSDGSGTPAGYLVTGKELHDADIVQALQLPAKLETVVGGPLVQIWRGQEQITIAKQVRSLRGEPIATLRFSVRRSLAKEGSTLLWLTAGGISILVIAMILLLAWRLRVTLIRPIKTFQAHVSGISRTGDLIPFDEKRHDELGALYCEFNDMADELNSLRAAVEAQSFAIGQSESAIGIMHNVRNAISPVHAIVSKLESNMQFPSRANVDRALDELIADTIAPERRRQLLTFVTAAIARASEDLGQHRSDLREALRSISQVVDAITSEHVSSGTPAPQLSVDCDLSAIIDSSLAIVRHHPSLNIAAELKATERFRVGAPRVLLAQVLDNLLTNAAEAIAATGRTHGAINIEVTRDIGAPDRFVQLTLHDDGDGFAPGDAISLFERGRSGRKKGSGGGIGLHWCANTLNALGGSIEITSGGNGTGAKVTLRLPVSDIDAHSDFAKDVAQAA